MCTGRLGGGSKQETSYLNVGEKPRVPVITKLSQVLEENPDPKYNLSQRACQGILGRAEKRGKVLPKMLKEALEEVVYGHLPAAPSMQN